MTDFLEQYGEQLVEYAEDKQYCSGAFSKQIAKQVDGLTTQEVPFLFDEIAEVLDGDVDPVRSRSNTNRYDLELVRDNKEDLL